MDNFAFYTDKEKKLKELRSNEEKIELKPGTKIIGPFAFRTPNAKEIILPDSVEVVQRYAFEGCQNLQRVVFGKGIKKIYSRIFHGCYKLNEIKFAGDDVSNLEFIDASGQDRTLLYGFTKFMLDCNVRTKSSDETAYIHMIEKFLKTKAPQTTLKITVGERSLRIPLFIRIHNCFALNDVLKKWLTDKNNNQSQWKTLTYFTDTATEDYSAALELYFLDGNINALKYLKGWTYSELVHVIKFGEYETFMEILKCDFLTDDELKSLVLYLTENQMIEAMAYLMEYMKKNKNTDFSL